MKSRKRVRSEGIERFESEAEFVVANQLDLLSQLEVQIRLVHRTMRQIEKLRSAKYRVGPELSTRERDTTPIRLKAELAELDQHLGTQQESCRAMHKAIDGMRARLRVLLDMPSPNPPG